LFHSGREGLRVCRLVAEYPFEGKATYGLQPVFYNLSREQARRGHDVHVIARRQSPGIPAEEVHEGIYVHRVEAPFTVNAFKKLRSLTQEKRGGRSVIHTHATSGVFLAALKGAVSAPVVSHVHGTTRSPYMPVVLKYGNIELRYSPLGVALAFTRERALWSAADRVLAVSSAVKRDLVSNYRIRPEKVNVVYNGVDTTIFRPDSGQTIPIEKQIEGKKVILYVGHFGLRKGIFHLIKAMKRIAKERDDVALVCVGGVPNWLGDKQFWEYLKSFIDQNDLRSKVHLLDKVPNNELPGYYCRASVFVLPSYYEAFAKVIIEAMACGVPAVSSRMGGALDAIDDGKTGFLFEYGNEKAAADAILTILEDERLASRMGALARQRVQKYFTWTEVANRVDSAYHQVLDRGWTPKDDTEALGSAVALLPSTNLAR
jgi:glycosyltransferase involved in cell wall biosynthesis